MFFVYKDTNKIDIRDAFSFFSHFIKLNVSYIFHGMLGMPITKFAHVLKTGHYNSRTPL